MAFRPVRGGMGCFIPASVTEVVAQVYFAFALVCDSRLSGQDVIRDDRPANSLAQLNLGFVFLKFAASDQQRAPDSLNGMAPFLFSVPLHKRTIAEADSSLAVNLRDLIAGPPEGAVHKPDTSRVGSFDPNHGGIRAMERNKFS